MSIYTVIGLQLFVISSINKNISQNRGALNFPKSAILRTHVTFSQSIETDRTAAGMSTLGWAFTGRLVLRYRKTLASGT